MSTKKVDETPNSVLAIDQADDSSQQAAKRDAAAQLKKSRSFKGVANLVIAMRRFQASLNPTYTYGKQQPNRAKHVRTPSPTHISSGSEDEHVEHYVYEDRGHKGAFLMKPLPPAPDELQQGADNTAK